MKTQLITIIKELNPWLLDEDFSVLESENYISRLQINKLLLSEWDEIWLILTGPRQAGKTTLGKYICKLLLQQKRFASLLYLNCDYAQMREWLQDAGFVSEAIKYFKLNKPIIFIDEVQRLESPGLLLKMIADLQLPIKMIATGSSQLELKSKVQEHLTGRHLESLVLPLSYSEVTANDERDELLLYGCYPQIVRTSSKEILLRQLFRNYIDKDIIQILRVSKPDIMQKLITLMAHCSGQLVNYEQLASDCRVNSRTIQGYLAILEKTYVIYPIKPFIGNKRSEITSNPIYYFIDNGFRNQALQNFTDLENRTDAGLLIEGAVFQEIYKFKTQHLYDFNIYYWRTKAGAEVDFVLQKGTTILPIEVKFRNMKQCKITRGFRSFIQAYEPKCGIVVTKNFWGEIKIDDCMVYCIPFTNIATVLTTITETFYL